MDTERTSKSIEAFLAFLRECLKSNSMATEDQREANEETQDILHTVELEAHDDDELLRIVDILRQVRKKRRIAKNISEETEPVVQWISENGPVLKSLERLLGDVRKAERRIDGRIYMPRTTILEEDSNQWTD